MIQQQILNLLNLGTTSDFFETFCKTVKTSILEEFVDWCNKEKQT